MELKGMCERCRENHDKIWQQSLKMWLDLWQSAESKKDIQYYSNCMNICEDICGPHGTCQYWRK